MKILVIDDDQRRSEKLIHYIVSEQVCERENVVWAKNSSEGRQMVSSQYFDVVVMDVVLPRRNNESASASNGLDFLRAVSRGGKYIRPGRIIGITAHLDEIEMFRERFNETCDSVVEARSGDASWRDRIVAAIRYTRSAIIGKSVVESKVQVITIHGIQTFGSWQQRLQNLTAELVPGAVRFHSYKYGFFSILAFLLPIVRNREVKILSKRLRDLFSRTDPSVRFVVFSHSFGTYLITKAIGGLIALGERAPIHTLVLSGSVLPERFSVQGLSDRGIRIVNDCGDHDYVLYISKAIVPGTGMAGKCGLYGFQGKSVLNRYFNGGHGHYFNGDDFMRMHWIPLLDSEIAPTAVDHRSASFFRHSVLDKIVVALGFIKGYVYISAFLLLVAFWAVGK